MQVVQMSGVLAKKDGSNLGLEGGEKIGTSGCEAGGLGVIAGSLSGGVS